MRRFDSGMLRLQATLQQVSVSSGTSGAVTYAWVDITTRRVFMRPLVGREYVEAQTLNARLSHKVRMRYYSGLSPVSNRLKIGTRILDIVSVADVDERHEEHELLCSEAVVQ